MTAIEEGEHVSEAVLRAVAAVSNRPILELPPLGECVDVDSLDQLFTSSTSASSLQFSYEGYLVIIESDHVRVREQSSTVVSADIPPD